LHGAPAIVNQALGKSAILTFPYYLFEAILIKRRKSKDLIVTRLAETLALNNTHKVETSELDMTALKRMIAGAFYSITDDAHGLLISFDQTADYEGENFAWFKARFERFVYVDRIIVAAHTRGKGLARHYYMQLFEKARQAGHIRITCEINLDPPNPGSLTFHQNIGFAEIGQATLSNGKTVSYQEKLL
jgi:uncharacterized protein